MSMHIKCDALCALSLPHVRPLLLCPSTLPSGMDMDAAAEEARLGTQGAFNYNRWVCLALRGHALDQDHLLLL